LFRDPERQKIAGVCAGLAHYVGMDITAMRAIWLGIFILEFSQQPFLQPLFSYFT
jgi:phage shock protein PspC (stress-responsive transcriptional regulator)